MLRDHGRRRRGPPRCRHCGGVGRQLVHRVVIEIAAVQDDASDLPRVAHIVQRIRVEQHQIRDLARLHHTQIFLHTQKRAGFTVDAWSASIGVSPLLRRPRRGAERGKENAAAEGEETERALFRGHVLSA
jgi:hypothetical protein